MRSRRLAGKLSRTERRSNGGSDTEPDVFIVLSSASEGEDEVEGGAVEEVPKVKEEDIQEEVEEDRGRAKREEDERDVLEEEEAKMKIHDGSKHRKSSPGKDKQKEQQQQRRKGRDDEEAGDAEGSVKKSKNDGGSSNAFTMGRVRKIIKSEAPDIRAAQEAIFLINEAAKKFVQSFCEDAHSFVARDRRSPVTYKHLSSAVRKHRRMDFLSDFVPEKLKAEDALAEKKMVET